MPEYDDQYALEVARAQRGSGFIAANIGDTGEVLSEAIDPGYLNAPSSDYRAAAALAAAITRRREEEARAEMRAQQFREQQEFKSLVDSGWPREEALRRVTSRFFNGSSAALYNAYKEPEPKVDLTRMRAEQDVIRDQNRQKVSRIGQITSALTGDNYMMTPPAQRPGLTNELNRLQGELETGRSNYLQTATQPKTQPKEGSLVRDRTNGKLYRIVNGQPVEQPGR